MPIKIDRRDLGEGKDFKLLLAGAPKREEQKLKAYYIMDDESKSLCEKVAAAEMLMEAWYWRSAQANHPLFFDYVAMLLNQEEAKDKFAPDVYKALVKKYGKMKGIPKGSYYSPKLDETAVRDKWRSKTK